MATPTDLSVPTHSDTEMEISLSRDSSFEISLSTSLTASPALPFNLSELNVEMLRSQQGKLKRRLQLKNTMEADLLNRMELLEKRQRRDDSTLNVINRYWMQLDEDLALLLQRSASGGQKGTDGELAGKVDDDDAINPAGCAETTTSSTTTSTNSFVAQLSTWNEVDFTEKSTKRVQSSIDAMNKIIAAFEQRRLRNENVMSRICEGLRIINLVEQNSDTELTPTSLNELLRFEILQMENENETLACLNATLEDNYQAMEAECNAMCTKLSEKGKENADVQNHLEDLQWDMDKLLQYNYQLVSHRQSLISELRRRQHQQCSRNEVVDSQVPPPTEPNNTSLTDNDEVEVLKKENEELREQASDCLTELEKLTKALEKSLLNFEELRMKFLHLPESVIIETTKYKELFGAYCFVHNDRAQLHSLLSDAEQQLREISGSSRLIRNALGMEMKKLENQSRHRKESIQLQQEIQTAQVDLIKLKLERALTEAMQKQGKDTVIDKEETRLNNLVRSYGGLLQRDINRHRRKFFDHCQENVKLVEQRDALVAIIQKKGQAVPSAHLGASSIDSHDIMDGMNAEAAEEVSKESEDIKILQEQLRESRENQQKMKDQLEMHRNVLKDVRTSAQIADSQKRLMDEINAMKSSIAKIKNQSDGRSKLESEDHEEWTKYKSLEQKVHSLQMQVTKQKSDQDALANDIEAIGEAYEDTNEQLVLLGHQFQKMDKDSVRLFARLGGATRLTNIVDADVQVVRDKKTALERELGDREECRKLLDDRHAQTLGTVVRLEQEDLERRYAAEVGKRVAIQRGQEAQDLSLQLETCIKNMVHVEQIKEEKSRALEGEAFRATQLQKEIALVKREVVRLETIEMTGSSTDEVRLEEVNELREALKCPSCQVRLKDAVLTICYHVFCFECLRTRYESRQRKCPKCNAAFGANDYKYIKLSEDDDDDKDFDKY